MTHVAPNDIEPANRSKGLNPRVAGRWLLYTAIVTFCLAAVASIGVILFGDFGGTEGRILLSSFSIAAYSLAGLIATARFGRSPEFLAPFGLASAGLGLILTLGLIWTDFDSDGFARLTFSVMVIAIALAHANLLLADPKRADPAASLLWATLVVSAILTAMIVAPILFDAEPDGGYWKSLAVLAVLLVLGTLVVPIVRKIKDNEPRSTPEGTAPVPLRQVPNDGWLELSYRGRVVRVTAEPVESDQSGVRVRAWVMNGPEESPIPLSSDVGTTGDPYAGLGKAVTEITRAIDGGLA